MGLFTKLNMITLEPKDINNGKIVGPLVGKVGMVVVAADWCGHCVRFAPEWVQFRKLIKDDRHFIICAVDSVKHPEMAETLNVRGYPTILDIMDDGSTKEYSGERDIMSLVSNMCKRTSRNNRICFRP